jgi:S-layer homology domain
MLWTGLTHLKMRYGRNCHFHKRSPVLKSKHPAIFLSLAVVLTSLTACANSPVGKNLEQSLAADPKLGNNPNIFGEARQNSQKPEPTLAKISLPSDFPKEIPIYTNAQLQEVTPNSDSKGVISTRWLSSDPSNFIENFYRTQFPANNWQVLQQPTSEKPGIFEARRNDLLVKLSIQAKSITKPTPNQPQTSTEILIDYSPNGVASVESTPTPTPTTPTNPEAASTSSQPEDPNFIGPVLPTKQAIQTNVPPNTTTSTVRAQEFSDLNKAPQELQKHIQDLAALGVLPLQSNPSKSNSTDKTNLLEPGKTITRREYARWLVAANNAMYANNPAKQIRLAVESAQPAFSDVPKTNPDFPAIQGLAEAGLIPSSLSGDTVEVLFRPDAPLTREQLLFWKLPLDTRQGLPAANLEAVKQTWGFQDAGRIDSKALRAVLADYQNGEQSNIRRVFGYTTLFQPKKPVTRAEAAGALWYFGTQGEGISATDALKLKR